MHRIRDAFETESYMFFQLHSRFGSSNNFLGNRNDSGVQNFRRTIDREFANPLTAYHQPEKMTFTLERFACRQNTASTMK